MSQTVTGQPGDAAGSADAATPGARTSVPVAPADDPLGREQAEHPELRRNGLTRRALTTDLLVGWLLAVGAGSVLATGAADVGRVVGLLALVAASAVLIGSFPGLGDPDDPREAVYRSGRLGRRLGTRSGFGGLGRYPGLRMLAAAVVLVLWLPRQTDLVGFGAAVLGVLCLVLAVAVEPFAVRLLRLPSPYAVRLPRLPQIPDRSTVAWLPATTGLLATALAGVVAVTGLPGWLLLLVAIAGALPLPVVIRAARKRRRIAARAQRRLAKGVAEYAPEFVLYTARPDDAAYQVRMWLPYLTRAGRRFMIVTREELPAELLAAGNDLPVVCCRSVADLDLIMAPSLRAAFYVNASSGNGALIRYHQLHHVYLGHGDSDKPPSYNPTHAMYDRIFTAGPAANRRYAEHGVRIAEEKFQVVGRPQVEQVRPAAAERLAERAAGAPPVILYAPTWRGHVSETALSSMDRAEAIVQALIDRGARVIFRPHPFCYDDPEHAAIIGRVQSLLAADAWERRVPHLFGAAAETDLDAFGCMNAADVMISDVSSVVSDFLNSGKPVAMVAPPEEDDVVGRYPVARAAYLIDHDLDRLPAVLDELLVPTGDRLAAVRGEVRNDYLGDFPVEGYADAFVQAVREVCDAAPSRTDAVAESEDGSTGVSKDTLWRNLDQLARTMISGVTAVGALAAAVAGLTAVGLVAALIAAAAVIITLVRGRSADRAPALEGPRMIVVGSAAVALAVTALTAGAAGLTAGWAAAGMLLMIMAVTAERWIRTAVGFRGVIADQLPGLPGSSGQDPDKSAGQGIITAAPIATAVLGLAGWLLVPSTGPSSAMAITLLWLLAAAVLLIMVLLGLRNARRRLAGELATEAALPRLLADFGPRFCVYFGSGIGARYQVGMWLPYFQRLGRPFMIITRSLPMMDEIVELTRGTGIPVIHRPTLRSMEDVLAPGLTVAFYVNNAVRNTHLIERRELTHVWLNHGDSEKPACYNPVHAIYDRIFAAGQAGIDRYARHDVQIPAEKFTIVGRPQTELIKTAREPISQVDQPTVLYAPTWQGPYADSRVYSLPQGPAIVRALLDRGVRVIFRAHPFNYRFTASAALVAEIGHLLERDHQRTGTEHLWGLGAEQQLTIEECFNASDAMITDVSAVMSDYLASGKPYAVVAVGRTIEELHAEAPAAEAGYPISEDLSDLQSALDSLLVSDPAAQSRERMRQYYLGDFDPPAAGFLTAAADLLADRSPE